MPTYEYCCTSCNHAFELEQKITDEPVRECPQCKKLEVKRLISGGTSFQLVGGGWARDNYSSTK